MSRFPWGKVLDSIWLALGVLGAPILSRIIQPIIPTKAYLPLVIGLSALVVALVCFWYARHPDARARKRYSALSIWVLVGATILSFIILILSRTHSDALFYQTALVIGLAALGVLVYFWCAHRAVSRIRSLRQSAGITQWALAAKADLSEATISKIECGWILYPIGGKHARRIAKALGVSVDDLWG
jgi:DNA-binding XRE family transcriptional regulator